MTGVLPPIIGLGGVDLTSLIEAIADGVTVATAATSLVAVSTQLATNPMMGGSTPVTFSEVSHQVLLNLGPRMQFSSILSETHGNRIANNINETGVYGNSERGITIASGNVMAEYSVRCRNHQTTIACGDIMFTSASLDVAHNPATMSRSRAAAWSLTTSVRANAWLSPLWTWLTPSICVATRSW